MEPIKNFRVRHEKVGSSQSKDSRHKKLEKKASSKEKSMDVNHNKKTLLPHKNKALTLKAEPEDKLKIRGSTIGQNNSHLKQIEDMKSEEENLKDKALSIIKSHHTNKILTLSNEQITISQKNLINIISQYLGEIKKCEKKISDLKKERRKK
jgi:protein tyrosine/serine phosphatase